MNKEITKQVEKIGEILEQTEGKNRRLLDEFFNLLFWKDYQDGHVCVEDRMEISTEIEEATINKYYDGDDNSYLHTKKILPFINKIRKQIGLKELTTELGDCLMEMTTEIKKEIIMKRLEE